MINTKTYGDISVFVSNLRAHTYQLSDTQISGDISVFANLTNLNILLVNT